MEKTNNLKKKKRPKQLTYRTPDRFKRLVFRRKPAITKQPRSLGGHR